MDNATAEVDFWKEAIGYAERSVKRVRLNSSYTGDVAQVKEDMVQDCLVAIAEAIKNCAKDLDPVQMRSFLGATVRQAIQKHLFFVNRRARKECSASEWLENIGSDENGPNQDEQEPEETERDALAGIIENHENDVLKKSIMCLDKESQAIVLLRNDGFSTRQIGQRINRHRERARQLYWDAMRKLKAAASGDIEARELPLVHGQDTLLYSTQEEKLRELRYRPRSTQGNISNTSRIMRQTAAKSGGQLSLF